jgi:cytochrome c oxidase subunit IV
MANEVANKNKTKERNKDILLKVFWSLVIIAMVSRIIYYFGTIGMICILSGLLIYNLILMGKK